MCIFSAFFECLFLTSVQFTLHVTSVKLVFCQNGTSRPLYQFLPAMCCTDNDDSKRACATRRGPFQEDKLTSHLRQCVSRSDVLVFTHQSQLSVLTLFNTADRKEKHVLLLSKTKSNPCPWRAEGYSLLYLDFEEVKTEPADLFLSESRMRKGSDGKEIQSRDDSTLTQREQEVRVKPKRHDSDRNRARMSQTSIELQVKSCVPITLLGNKVRTNFCKSVCRVQWGKS